MPLLLAGAAYPVGVLYLPGWETVHASKPPAVITTDAI